ncbi:hypothetical protein WA026_018900 [Henosepilachna vigintioctopunctata]|uniref:Amino acid transporter transmembrane domain-containing protein n=1 Tax=Henosepilachna vigintioctopunctata TaxID=420089 RepID=A0AAW1UPZ3_9CUCU
MDIHIHMAIVFTPILLTSLIRNLKFLAPLSTIANVFMTTGLLFTIYYCVQDLPPISERIYVANIKTMPLFFGTAMFAFEGIGLVLPLQKEMRKPENFKRPLGVLNVGTSIAIVSYISMGFLAYLKYDDIKSSVTLNLPPNEVLAQCVKIIISLGILLTYSLQFYIPVEIMWPTVLNYIGDTKHPVYAELVFRTLLVIITFVLAEAIPFLDLFISLVGAVSSAALALMFPPILNLVILYSYGELTLTTIVIDVGVCLCGIVGAVTGTYTSIYSIINAIEDGKS